jgi:serine/threonine protein kinase/tetratricopeptide (TPR) repeat protein
LFDGVRVPSLDTFADRFRIEQEAGAGGMGTIYRAIDLHTNERIALKVLQRSEGRSAERFNQEAALLAELAHPAVVRYVDHGVTAAGEAYLAMEWLEGETLEERLLKGNVTLMETVRLGRRVLEGLAVAHRKGIIHRDIKPSNLFLPGGDLSQVKVLDFGIARRMFEAKRITLAGSTLGTPMYMSPEQARGSPTIDARSDLFSLGCVLFECASGKPPFTAETPVAVLAKICLEDIDVRDRFRDAPTPFVSLINRLLAKDPNKRARGAAEMAGEFAGVIDLLISLGYEKNEADELLRRAPTPILTSSEQRVLSAILVSRPRSITASISITSESMRAMQPPGSSMHTWDLPGAAEGNTLDVFDETGFADIQAAIEPFGARVDRFLGGSMVITLVGRGAPTDQATQVARCALKLKAMLPRAALAVSTGRAELGRDLPMGEVIDYAARLMTGEKGGSICLDGHTAGLLESRFEVSAREGTEKKYLLFEKGVKEAPRTVLGKEMPCVGRDREIGTLEALFDECTGEPTARVVVVTSPAGGGKSRVRHEFLERIQSRGEAFEFLVGRGDSLRAGAPFALLGPALCASAGIAGGEPLNIQQKRLFAHLSRHVSAEAQKRVVAFLGEIAGVQFPDEYLPALAAARQDPRLMADQIMAAWLDWLEVECSTNPVLLVLEDLHWGDAPSVQLVDAALRTLRDRPLMVVAFARPEVDERFTGLWADRDVQRIALAPLTSKACQKLARHVLGSISAEKAAWIVERADGNPFYLEELLRAVASGADLRGGNIPATVIGMVQARFDALGTEAKRVLRAAAVFGETFRAAGVRALVGDQEGNVDEWLDILVQREVVFPRQAADAREYVFRHALVRDAAYEMLTAQDCRLGHRLAGEYLEQAGERAAIVLVEHFERAAELERAAHWSRFAAAQALDANDLAAVIERVERGIRCGARGEILGGLRYTESQARFFRGEFDEAETAAREAVALVPGVLRLQAKSELIAALGQQTKFAEVEREATEVRAQAPVEEARSAWLACLLRAAGYLLPAGRYELSQELLDEVEQQRDALEPLRRVRLANLKALVDVHHGHIARALAGFEAALATCEPLGDARASIEMLTNLGMALGELGVLADAEQRLSSALANAERMGLNFIMSCILLNLSQVRAYLGRLDEARAAGERAVAIAREQSDRRIGGCSEIYLSRIALLAARPLDAESLARSALETLAGISPLVPSALASLAVALLAQGRRDEALAAAARAHSLLEAAGSVEDGEAFIRLAYAECLLAAGSLAPAAATLHTAARRLEDRAASIEKPEWRAAFLHLPDHARTLSLAQSHLPAIRVA